MILFNLCALLSFVCPPKGYIDIKDQNPVHIQTPDLKKRQTAKIRLCNGLSAYIISDPGADQSAAAVAVTAGSWLDPKEYPGTAHFLEHLLFLGNKAYPEEDEFMGYIQSNGGLVNAYTASDRTVYMFSVNNNAFDGGLNRFAHFFIDPLFDPSGVGRELHAVDQENAKNIENDSWRWWMILKETGNQNSPNATFSTGNAKTLGQIPPNEVRKWWEDHYSADKMHLVIYSNQPLDQLKERVLKDFGQVAKRPVDDHLADVNLLSPSQEGHIFYIEPVRDVRDLTLTWELPDWAAKDIGAKYPQLLAYVLGNGANNGLESLLKKQGLAEGVSGDVMRLSQDKALFMLSVDLTRDGVKNRDAVIQECFDYLHMLQETGIPEYIYRDLQKMALINYEWQTRQSAFNYVQTIASQLPYENLATYPSKTIFYDHYNPKRTKALLNTLTPKNCFFSLVAPTSLTGISPDHQEKWLGGKYAVQNISVNPAKNLAQLGLPKQNPFIPTQLQILPKQRTSKTPTLIANDAFGMSYYTDASEFPVPEVAWAISLKSPVIDGTPKHSVLLDLFTRTANEKLTSELFFAAFAGLNGSIGSANLKLTLQVSGYSNKAQNLLDEMINVLKNAKPTAAEFAIYKESLLTTYANNQKAMPFMQANDLMASVIYNDSPTSKNLYDALSKTTYQDYLEFADALTKQLYAETLFAGNLTESDAEHIWKHISNTLSGLSYPKDEQHTKNVFVLNDKGGPYAISQSTPMQGNATLLLIEQGSFSYKNRAAQEILGTALSDGFFKELRTKQQTGYIAKGWKRDVSDELLQFFAVQSATHGPDDLLSRFELFLENFVKDFGNEFSEERFEEVRKGVLTTLTNPPTNLDDLTSRLYTFAYVKDGDFDYLKNTAKAAKEMTYDEIHDYALEFFSRQNKRRLAILLQGAPTGAAFTFQELSPMALKEQGSFR